MVYSLPEQDQGGLGAHCMTLVMRYLLVSRAERETKNDLKSLLLGSERPSGLYNLMTPLEPWNALTMSLSFWSPPHSDILCCLGVMFTFEESDLSSAKMFPSQHKSSESVK